MHFFSSPLQRIKKANHGFTLIELIVSIMVFSIVMLAAVDVMMSVFQAQAKAIAFKDVMDNGRFALELITRELRTGANVTYTATPPPGCPLNGLQFTSFNQGSAQERFYYWQDTDGDLIPDALMRVVMPTAGSVNCTAFPAQQFTAEEIIVDRWTLTLMGILTGPTDGQPRITMSFVMHSRNPRLGSNTKINLQTTVTLRLRDL